jgi:hypothetical protein
MSDAANGQASKAAQDADATDKVSRNTKSQTTASSYTTTDHDVIRQWAEARGACPASVGDTGSEKDAGILRLEFPDGPGEDAQLDDVDWEPFFATFEDRGLAFVYQEQTSEGSTSRFSKFIDRASEPGDLSLRRKERGPATRRLAVQKRGRPWPTRMSGPRRQPPAARSWQPLPGRPSAGLS